MWLEFNVKASKSFDLFQLTVVTLMTAIPFLHHGTMTFVRSTPSLYFVSYIAFMVVYFTLMCCESVRRFSF